MKLAYVGLWQSSERKMKLVYGRGRTKVKSHGFDVSDFEM